MINCENFFNILERENINFFTGVPDSLLADFCAYITDHVSPSNHIIAANEGNALSYGIGTYLATGQLPLIYLQNSGFGNLINPLLSLADDKVYGVPMLILMGWRGEPGVKDEPQHIRQGEVNLSLLESLNTPYLILDSDSNEDEIIKKAVDLAIQKHKPVVILVRKDTFSKYKLLNDYKTDFPLIREDAIKLIIDTLDENDIVVSTTGKASREVFEYRKNKLMGHSKDFLTVGGMGHTSSIALGIASRKQDRQVFCLDGDGSVLMHMGAMAINGLSQLGNFNHVVINNGAHDSVGGQPTVAFDIDLAEIAKATKYTFIDSVSEKKDIISALEKMKNHNQGSSFLEIKVNKGAREELIRPTTTPIENKEAFEKFIR